jgi:hypothetical protein
LLTMAVGLHSPLILEMVHVKSDLDLIHIPYREPSVLFMYFKRQLQIRFPDKDVRQGDCTFGSYGLFLMIVYMKALHDYFMHNLWIPTNSNSALKDPCNCTTLNNMPMYLIHTVQIISTYCRIPCIEIIHLIHANEYYTSPYRPVNRSETIQVDYDDDEDTD